MIEPLFGLVVIFIFTLAICVIGCALCHCVPLLCVALGIGAWTHNSRRISRQPGAAGGQYSPLAESESQEIVEAEAYIMPPLDVRDGVHVVQLDSVGAGGSVAMTGMNSMEYSEKQTGSAPLLEDGEHYHRSDVHGSGPDGPGGTGGSHQIKLRGLLDCGMFKDTLAAGLFIANTVIVVGLAIKAFTLLMQIGTKNNLSIDQIDPDTLDAYDDGLPGAIMAFGFVALFATVVTCSVYLTLLMKYSAQLITATIWASISFFAVACALSILNGVWLIAIMFALFAGISYWWLKASASRIEFASVILKTAVSAVKDNFCPLMSVSLFVQCLQLAYMLAWLMAFVYYMIINYDGEGASQEDGTTSAAASMYDGEPLTVSRRLTEMAHSARMLQHVNVRYNQEKGHLHSTLHTDEVYSSADTSDGSYHNHGPGGFIIFLFLLSLYWGIQVCRNVVSTTVSGTMACWWFTPSRKAIVAGALFRSFTASFGSICLGSLLVSIVQAVKAMLERMRDAAHRRREGRSPTALFSSCFLYLMSCVLNIVENVLEYINKYALVYCAAYGTNFATSGARVWDLFKRRGWTQIINDSLIGNCLSLGVFATACLTSIFAYLSSFLFSQDLAEGGVEKPRLVVAVGGFVLGLVIGLLVSNMIESAVASVFVFFAEDPKELQRNHPAIHDELCVAWLAAHPSSLNVQAGGTGAGGHGNVVQAHAVSHITGTESSSGVALSPTLQREGVTMGSSRPTAPMAPSQLAL